MRDQAGFFQDYEEVAPDDDGILSDSQPTVGNAGGAGRQSDSPARSIGSGNSRVVLRNEYIFLHIYKNTFMLDFIEMIILRTCTYRLPPF